MALMLAHLRAAPKVVQTVVLRAEQKVSHSVERKDASRVARTVLSMVAQTVAQWGSS